MIPENNLDVIDVRPDETFDEARLADYLEGKLEGGKRPLTVKQFGGGAANLTYLLDYSSHQYVLRRPPLGPVAKSAHDMAREYRVLSVLHRAFPYAPQAFHYCKDPAIIGADFFIMARQNGTVVRRSIPAPFTQIPNATRQMSLALVDALAELHAVDYAALSLETLGKPDGFLLRQVEGWYRRWQKAQTENVPEMDTLYAWLKTNLPQTQTASLIHNDYKLDNVMLAPDNPGQIVAIFDWDMCTLGDPLSDLGALLTYWTEPSDPPWMQAFAMMPIGDLGFMSRAELVERYAEKRGESVHNINFYHALGLFRVTVIIAQIYIRYQRGQTQDQRFAALGPMIPFMARAGQAVAEK